MEKELNIMTVSKKQQANVTRYVSKHYDQIKITVPKGERDRYKALAAHLGISVNQLFVQAVERYIDDNIGDLSDCADKSEKNSE